MAHAAERQNATQKRCKLRFARMPGRARHGRRGWAREANTKPMPRAQAHGGRNIGWRRGRRAGVRVSYGSSSCACGKQVSMSSPLDLKRGNIHRARVFAPWNPPSPPVRVPRDPARDKPLFAATARAGFSSAKQPACPARQGERTLFDGIRRQPWNLRVYAGVTLRATQLVREDSE
jgi:hypothetical protein